MEFRKNLDNYTIFGTLKIVDSASILSDCREKGLIMPSQEVESCLRKPSTRSWEKIGGVTAQITVFVLIAIIFVIAACRLSNGDFAGAVVLGTVACLGGMLVIVLVPNRYLEERGSVLSHRCELCNTVIKFTVGAFLAAALGFWGNQLAENQLRIENRETAPQIEIKRTSPSDDSNIYEVSNCKGMASYVSLQRADRFRFWLNGKDYEITVEYEVVPESDNVHLDAENNSIRFVQSVCPFDERLLLANMADYITEKTGEEYPPINTTHVVTLSFFDCDNQHKEFEFLEDEGNIVLTSTDGRAYCPENNLRMYATPDWNIYNGMHGLIDSVVETGV